MAGSDVDSQQQPINYLKQYGLPSFNLTPNVSEGVIILRSEGNWTIFSIGPLIVKFQTAKQ